MTRSSVDLPQPDGPISETNSPRSTSRSDVLQRGDAAARERLRDVAEGDDRAGVRRAHAICSGGRRTTSFSATTTARKNAMPSAAAIRFVAHRYVGVSE